MSQKGSNDQLYAMRHSMAHILASAVQQIWPHAKFGVGPVVENGFYYDIDLGSHSISTDDLSKIEGIMHEIIKRDEPFEKSTVPISEAVSWAKEAGQPYKQELLQDLEKSGTTNLEEIERQSITKSSEKNIENVSFYRNGSFLDLCRGPHLDSTGNAGHFKLIRVSGAYWRGDEKNTMMQRIYGVAFNTTKELELHLENIEEAKRRDHRKIGKELDLFVFSDLIGAGLPLYTPRGTYIKNQLDDFVQELRSKYDYQEVSIPHITKKDAYIKSGHWQKFSDELFKITTRENHEFAMKPMNCPHHTQIYASQPRSYKDLPIRYRETTVCYRDEQSGELSGLSRTRGFTQDDAHVFCRKSDIESETNSIWDIIDKFYSLCGFELRVRLSTHDPKKQKDYSGKPNDWKAAEEQLKKIVEDKMGDEYELGQGEAAFYGPKIDFIAKDALGRVWQVATIQLDFNQPEGFDLNCINEKGDKERIVMIHAAIMGSIDRFLSIYLEHTGGKLPAWLAPEQFRIISVNSEPNTMKYIQQLEEKLRSKNIKYYVDSANESVGKKIAEAQTVKVPYTVVVGEKEIASDKFTPRIREDLKPNTDVPTLSFDDLVELLEKEIQERSPKTLVK